MHKSLLASSPRAFLGVERSVLGRPWRSRLDAAGEARALGIAQIHGTGDLLSRVLAGRGVTAENTQNYLDPTLRTLLPDPFSLQDMKAAANRIAEAVERGEKIAIFGDYDVDGAASSALLCDYFRVCGTPCVIYIPDRIFEGYGPNPEAIQNLARDGAKLLIAVDCGTASHAPLAEAQRLGLDPIVLDHHQAPEILPNAIVVNPNRQDDLSGLGQLCAAGVVFMTLVAVQRACVNANFFPRPGRMPDLLAGLDLVALATIADVAPLTGLNRAFVTKGLALMQLRERPGLKVLLDIAGLAEPPAPYHLGFLIGPRINAGGRIGDAALGAKLLTLADPLEAQAHRRRTRPAQSRTPGARACDARSSRGRWFGADPRLEHSAAIVAAGDGWHPGIAGLIAARLKEKFRRPAFAIAFDANGVGTGSGRSISGVDLGRVVRAAVEAGILIKGGGHAMAAGITLARERLGDFKDFLEAELSVPVAAAQAGEALLIDAALTAGGATAILLASLATRRPLWCRQPGAGFCLARASSCRRRQCRQRPCAAAGRGR